MSIIEFQARVLKDLGFPQKKTEPGDLCSKNDDNDTLVVGGTLKPQVSLLVPSHLLEEWVWIPSHEDLIAWLDQNTTELRIVCLQEYYPPTFCIDLVVDNTLIQTESVSFSVSLFHSVVKVLFFNNNQPYTKGYVRKFLKKRFKEEEALKPPLVDDDEEE